MTTTDKATAEGARAKARRAEQAAPRKRTTGTRAEAGAGASSRQKAGSNGVRPRAAVRAEYSTVNRPARAVADAAITSSGAPSAPGNSAVRGARVSYDHAAIARRWSARWDQSGIYHVDLWQAPRPYYNLMMFPYPSAEGLHVGNMYAFTGADIHGRYMAMRGYDVFAVREATTGREVLVPAVADMIKRVDVAAGVIVMDPIAGLFDERFEAADDSQSPKE